MFMQALLKLPKYSASGYFDMDNKVIFSVSFKFKYNIAGNQ